MIKKRFLILGIGVLISSCGGEENRKDEQLKNSEEDVVWQPVFEPLPVPSQENSFYPRLSVDPENQDVLLSWYTKKDGEAKHQLLTSTYRESWSEAELVAEGENWFVNWADFPAISAFAGGKRAISYLQMNGDDLYSYEVRLKVSEGAGEPWQKSFVPHLDNSSTEHGFVSMAPAEGGELGMIWLDGRKYAQKSHQPAGHDEHGSGGGEMTLRFARINPAGNVLDRQELDERTCDCCQTAMATTPSGLFAAYRDRTENEIRDISYIRYLNGEWTKPKTLYPDGWEIKGCPVNGPAVAAERNEIAVAWFTGADNNNRVRLIRSGDGGESWKEPVTIDEEQPLGRVGVSLLPDGSAVVSWLADEGKIKVKRLNSAGRETGMATVAKVEGSRSSGFPQIVYREGAIYLAWTENGESKEVKVVRAEI